MGQFDFYVLALSWSPGFCENSGSRSRQCDSGSGLGFVTHGLWPQHEQGYPSFCEPNGRFVPAGGGRRGRRPFPGRATWRAINGASTAPARAKPRAAISAPCDSARELVRIPDGFKELDSRSQVLPIEIERAFVNVNPGLRPDMMAVSCGRRIFQEVRICLDRDLRGFRAMPRGRSRRLPRGRDHGPGVR